MMKTRRILSEDKTSVLSRIHVKDSSAFIEDMQWGKDNELTPSLVKITDQDAWTLFEGNEWIFSTVDRIVHDCVKVKPQIVPIDKTKKVQGRISGRIKQVKDFLDNPNNNKESFFEIREKVIRDMLVYGRGSIEKVLGTGRTLQEVYALNPKYLKICADIHGNIPTKNAYVLNPPAGVRKNSKIFFDIDELIFMVLLPTSGTMYGLKVLDAICNSVAADILRATYNAKFFINGAEASGIVGLEGMSKTELNKFRAYWKENFKGASKAHKTAVVNVPIKYVRMALTNRDLQFKEYGTELRTKIFAAYHMQPFVMGVVDQTTGKLNSGQQIEAYKDGALRPILIREAYYYTQEIIKMGFGFNDIAMEFADIDLADVAAQTEIDRNDVSSGIIVINEVRRRRGLSEVPWGNTPVSLAPGGGQVDPTTGQIIPPSNQGDNGISNPKKPSAKPSKKSLFDKYINSVMIKLDTLIVNSFEQMKTISDINVQEFFKEKQLFVNGKVFKVKDYHLPVECKKTELWDMVEKCIDLSFVCNRNDIRYFYLEAIASKIRFLFFNAIAKKNLNNILVEIDTYIYEERKSDIYLEIF